jgi:hypothetical protein
MSQKAPYEEWLSANIAFRPDKLIVPPQLAESIELLLKTPHEISDNELEEWHLEYGLYF